MAQAEVALWSGRAESGTGGWSTGAAPGSRTALAVEQGPQGASLRLDFALSGHGSWAIARRELAFELPPHYVFTLRLRGEATPSTLQLKLVDPSGANVWWWRRPGFVPAREGERIVLRPTSLEFAWGPKSGGDPDRVGA